MSDWNTFKASFAQEFNNSRNEMSEIKDGGPAFPVTYEIENGPPDNAIPGYLYPGSKSTVVCSGLTVRDYFAAKVLDGLMANSTFPPATPIEHARSREDMADSIAASCYRLADAMLRARSQS